MAYYAALLSTIELLEDILHPLRFPNSFVDDTPTFNSLHQKFGQLLDSLQDYSSIGRDSDPMEARIKDASYQALDMIESQILQYQQHVSLGRLDWKEELQKVAQEVDSVVQEITAIKQSKMHEDVVAATASEQEQQQPVPIDISERVVGFEEQVLAIKELLCGSSPELEVIPIVGMGGIGKTTLARHTFDDRLVVSKFDFRGWVTISQEYHVIRVLLDIVKSLGFVVTLPDDLSGNRDNELAKEHERKNERALKERIYKHLKGRRFLVVIDDVWNTNVWDDIKPVFPKDCNGSRIMLTSRLTDVAEYVGSINSLYQVQFLDAGASWALLQEKAFVKEWCPSELVNIGKSIASKCKGLPLAIVVIGGILSNDKTLRYWESVAENVGSVLNNDDEHMSNILSLSYNHLPHHLKPCFLHVGSFPEDYEINISKLIKLWIAEGFLKSVSHHKNLEEIGDAYLNDLVKRNLVIITKKKANGEFKSLVMHDLLRDFSRRKGLDEHFFHTVQEGHLETKGVEKVRRIVLDSNSQFQSWETGNGKYVQSICRFTHPKILIYDDDDDDELKWDRVNLLRIFDVADGPLFPFSSPNMFHLKYLSLSLSSLLLHDIEPSISTFQNLETLIIHPCALATISLPSEIWKMLWLKYVMIERMELPPIPRNIPLQKLEYLHTLETTVNFTFPDEVVQIIPNVRKLKLEVTRDEEDAWSRYDLYNLVNMLHLEKLSIIFYDLFQHDGLVRSGFAFPQNLKKLSLEKCGLPWEAMTLVGSLKCLQVLKSRDDAFVGEVWEPVEGEFQELKFLLLEDLHLLQWKAESTHFPMLQHLRINKCSDLEEIPLDIGEIGTLESITVKDSEQAGDSARKILEEQQELGNYELQVIVDKVAHAASDDDDDYDEDNGADEDNGDDETDEEDENNEDYEADEDEDDEGDEEDVDDVDNNFYESKRWMRMMMQIG